MRRNSSNNKNKFETKSKTGKSSSRKRGNRPRNCEIKEEERSGNNPAWYASNTTILRDAASFPFSYNTGATEIHDPTLWTNTFVTRVAPEQISGICSLRVLPLIGTSTSSTDPVNVAAQSVYSFVRHANSGHSNYDACDLMLYILAMANMYSYLVFCQRAYGYALTYDQRNRYIPNDLLRTNNIDATDLVNNLANFRFWINTLIAKMVSFAVPATMSIFSRMSFMYSDYYIEGTSIKEQVYQYVPEGFYQFGLDSSSLGELAWVPFNYSQLMTTADLMSYGDALFNAIWSQEDFGIMSGDILKAYGINNIIKLQQIPEYYSLVPKFDPMVLTQMKNADLTRTQPVRISQSSTTGDILQVVIPQGYTTSDVAYGTTHALSSGVIAIVNQAMTASIKDYRILSVDTDDPTPEVVIEASRLKVGYDANKGWFKCGTEIITHAIVTIEPGVDMDVQPHILYIYNNSSAAWAAENIEAVTKLLDVVKNFHYMPRFWLFGVEATAVKACIDQSFDIDNYTILTYEDVRKLHEAATVNMFAVPSIGSVTNV